MRGKISLLFIVAFALSLGACSSNNADSSKGNSVPISSEPINSENSSLPDSSLPSSEEPPVENTYLSVTEAVALAREVGEEGTKERQYVTGTVKSISNANYGEMYITDGTSDLYIYGVYSKDGALRYPELEEKPYTGDEVFLYGIVKTYNGSPEMGASWLQKMVSHQGETDITDYQEASILEARNAVKGSKVRVSGVVAHISHANGMVPNGFYLVDKTSSIYVYSNEVAGRVEIGEEIEIAGTRDDYILESERTYAEQYGYLGSIQLADPIFIKSIAKNKEFDKSWIANSTVKDMMDTPLNDNITTRIYKVNAIINKAPGAGFVNYYINDLDNRTGSYVYTLCNGSDFKSLDVYDGKICTVYLAVHNAKSAKAGIIYRLMPILVEENKNFAMSNEEIINFALKYYAKEQFLKTYNSDPELEVATSFDNEYIPFNNVTIAYQSDNETLVRFANEDNKLIMHVGEGSGEVNVTLTGSYNGKTASLTTKINVLNIELPETKTVAEAIETADDTKVAVRGIVMSSLVNQTGFYLNDGTGVIAVRTDKDTIKNIALGNEVVMEGTRKHVVKDGSRNVGQSCIDGATLIANLMGKNNYDTSTFITNLTFEEIFAFKNNQAVGDYTTKVYVAKCYLVKKASAYSTNYYLSTQDGSKQYYLYAGSGGQYADYDAFSDGRELTVTFMLCDWNTKDEYRACIVSASDGTTTVLNSLNFK